MADSRFATGRFLQPQFGLPETGGIIGWVTLLITPCFSICVTIVLRLLAKSNPALGVSTKRQTVTCLPRSVAGGMGCSMRVEQNSMRQHCPSKVILVEESANVSGRS